MANARITVCAWSSSRGSDVRLVLVECAARDSGGSKAGWRAGLFGFAGSQHSNTAAGGAADSGGERYAVECAECSGEAGSGETAARSGKDGGRDPGESEEAGGASRAAAAIPAT